LTFACVRVRECVHAEGVGPALGVEVAQVEAGQKVAGAQERKQVEQRLLPLFTHEA
jgi:hypothetical protein